MASEDIPAMDYDEHESTYSYFIEASKTGTVACVHILLSLLLLMKVETGLGTTIAVILTVAGILASLIGLMSSKNGWVATAVISGLMVLHLIFVAG